MRDTFVKTLLAKAMEDKNIQLITGDLGFGVLKPYWEAVPDQFINAGIAEQNMLAVAAGMALTGKTVVAYSIGNFSTMRCVEQIRNDCAYHNANVKIICVGGGFVYGSLGMSHHATEDIAVMRALPNVTVLAPGDAMEAEAVTRAMLEWPGTCYLRLGRGGEPRIRENIGNFSIGKALPVQQGQDVAIFSTGAIFSEVAKAREILESKGIVPTIYTFPTVKPLDEAVVQQCAQSHKLIVTWEEHSKLGGLGSAVAEVLAENPGKARLIRVGMDDRYCEEVGDQNYLRRCYGMDGETVAGRILEALG